MKNADKKNVLTSSEKQAIKVLNHIATFDGIIQYEDDIKYILQSGIEEFIHPKNREYVYISTKSYPMQIEILK